MPVRYFSFSSKKVTADWTTFGPYLCVTVLALKQEKDKQTSKQKEMQWKMGASKAKQNHLQPPKSAHEIVNMVHLLFYHSLLKWWEINTGTFLVCGRWVCLLYQPLKVRILPNIIYRLVYSWIITLATKIVKVMLISFSCFTWNKQKREMHNRVNGVKGVEHWKQLVRKIKKKRRKNGQKTGGEWKAEQWRDILGGEKWKQNKCKARKEIMKFLKWRLVRKEWKL